MRFLDLDSGRWEASGPRGGLLAAPEAGRARRGLVAESDDEGEDEEVDEAEDDEEDDEDFDEEFDDDFDEDFEDEYDEELDADLMNDGDVAERDDGDAGALDEDSDD